MWNMEQDDSIVPRVMLIAVLLMLVVLALMSLEVEPRQLSPAFATAAPTPLLHP